jgi:hypothetical protein
MPDSEESLGGSASGKQGDSEWKSRDLVYDYVRPSYDWTLRRLEANAGRIQALLTFVATFTGLVPIVARAINEDINFDSNWFYAALAMALLAASLGMLSKVIGGLWVVDIRTFSQESWRSYPKEKFEEWVIFYASEDLAHNVKLIELKWRFATGLTALFVGEALCMLVWVIRSL